MNPTKRKPKFNDSLDFYMVLLHRCSFHSMPITQVQYLLALHNYKASSGVRSSLCTKCNAVKILIPPKPPETKRFEDNNLASKVHNAVMLIQNLLSQLRDAGFEIDDHQTTSSTFQQESISDDNPRDPSVRFSHNPQSQTSDTEKTGAGAAGPGAQ